MRMKKFGLLKELNIKANYKGILLTPTASKFVSSEDSDIIKTHGICAIDCSWAKFQELKLNENKYEGRKCKCN